MAVGRVPPHSQEAEANVIGTMVLGFAPLDEIGTILSPEDFYGDKTRAVYEAAVTLQQQGREPSLVSIKDALHATHKLEWVTMEWILETLEATSASPTSWRHFAKEVRDLAIRRELRHAGMQLIENSERPQVGIDDLVEECEQLVFSIRRQDRDVEPTEDLAKQVIEDALERCRNPGIRGVATGYPTVDAIVGGMKMGTLNIIAALPSMGKTAYALNVSLNQAGRMGKVLFFSLEMSRQDIARNAICCITMTDAERATRGTLTTAEKENFSTMNSGPLDNILILDPPAAKLGSVRALARRMCSVHDVSLVVVDYLQLMYSKGDSRYVEAGQIAQGCKMIARELKLPVILLSQLSRGVWKEEDHRPNLSHLRDSGDIEAHADTVSFVHRPSYFKRDTHDDRAEIIVAKNRMGRCGTGYLRFMPQFLRFTT